MTCVRKDDDGETAQSWDESAPMDDSNWSSVCHSVAFEKMRQHQNSEVSDRHQCNNAGVLERVESTEEGKGNDDEPVKFSDISKHS